MLIYLFSNKFSNIFLLIFSLKDEADTNYWRYEITLAQFNGRENEGKLKFLEGRMD